MWVTAVAVGLQGLTPVLISLALGYVIVGSLVMSARSWRDATRAPVLWVLTVALWTIVLAPVDSAWPFTFAVDLLVGTLCFAAWALTAVLLVHTFAPNRPG